MFRPLTESKGVKISFAIDNGLEMPPR